MCSMEPSGLLRLAFYGFMLPILVFVSVVLVTHALALPTPVCALLGAAGGLAAMRAAGKIKTDITIETVKEECER